MQLLNRIIGFTALFVAGCGEPASQTVKTQSGPVQGVTNEGVAIFRGSPYATPPLGDLRWAAPQPAQPWTEPLIADAYGPSCWQPTGIGNDAFISALVAGSGMSEFSQWVLKTGAGLAEVSISEDCLTLNVLTPDISSDKPLPVMLWIHGGGHQYGSGGDIYESTSLANNGVVLVTINYRLGIYGFMAHPELAAEDANGSSGNYGMLDQIAALQWVQANIEKFGGDTNNVTIFGESAGGHSVGQLMASPLARGLFHKAIAQSGTGFQQFQTTDQNNETISGFNAGRSVAAMVDVSGSDEITQLRAMSVEELAEAATDLEISSTFHPQVDGYVLPKPTSQIFALGEQAPVPLMLGSNADEGSVLYYMGLTPVDGSTITGPETIKQWDNLLLNEFGDQANALSIHYAVDGDSDVVKGAEQLMGDSWFGRHAYFMAQRHSTAGHPTFMYFFERRSASPDETIGATHAFEIFPVFGSTLPLWPTDERDEILSNEMQSYWSNFAKAGDPNNDRAPAWQSFSLLQPTEMALGHEKSYSRPVARMDRYEAMNGQLLRREKRALELSE
jgi:para-nitrobenzyl esterase